MKIHGILNMKPGEIVKDVEKLKILFDYYKARHPGGVWVINTTPHDIHIGRETFRKADSHVYSLFSAEPVYTMVKKVNGFSFAVVDYVPIYREYRENILTALEELDLYALSSIITVHAFKSMRVIAVSRREVGGKRSGMAIDTFITVKEAFV